MKQYTFNYAQNFKCIADKCKHSCCEKWGVNIDKKSLKKYKKIKGDFSLRIKDGVDFKNKQFVMKNRRCAFLNDNNLCDLIINEGESSLCQVCQDHPRFRSFFDGRVELGLGLCCEEATRILLNQEDKISLISLGDGKEKLTKKDKSILEYRDKILTIVQDRKKTVKERIDLLSKLINFNLTDAVLGEYKTFLTTLEILDEEWTDILNSKANLTINFDLDPIKFEHILSYFIYRHLPNATNFDLDDLVVFSAISAVFIFAISSPKTLQEVVREYSAEIEYSTDNLFKAQDYISRIKRLGKI